MLDLNKKSHDVLADTGLEFARSGDYQSALDAFDKALTPSPHCAAFYNKAILLFHLGRYEEVLEFLADPMPGALNDPDRKLLEHLKEECGRRVGLRRSVTAEGTASALFKDAWDALENGSLRESLELFSAVLDIDPIHYLAWNNKAHILMELGEYEHAFVCILMALALDAQDVHAWCTMGEILARLEFRREALACFEESFRLDSSERIVAYLRLQLARWTQGVLPNAERRRKTNIKNVEK